MLFEAISGALGKKLIDVPLASALASLQAIVADEKALSFVKEKLRAKYSDLVMPSSYDWVMENLQLTKRDFIDYFKSTNIPTGGALENHLRHALLERSANWITNRPSEALLAQIVDDYLQSYQAYFTTTDPHLTTLNLAAATQEVLQNIAEIKQILDEMRTAKSPGGIEQKTSSFMESTISFLTAVNVPFEIVERSENHIEALITDPSSIFPVQFYLHVANSSVELKDVEEIVDRAKHCGRFSHILLVSDAAPTFELVAFAERRGVLFNSSEKFRDTLLRIPTGERFVVGSLAVSALLDAHNIQSAYIYPDAVSVDPGDALETKYLSTRETSSSLISSFIGNSDQRVLFILGGYGSGKSCVCARLLSDRENDANIIPVYVSLRDSKGDADLVQIVTKADQLGRTIGGHARRPLVILDGLDELPNALDVDKKRANLLAILKACAVTDKLIVTARTSYFRGMEDFWNLFKRTHDDPMWDELARFIPERKIRPKIKTIVLREFSTQQIQSYVEEYSKWQHKDQTFVDNFMTQLLELDRLGNYRVLAKNPLYLFLLASSEPWKRHDIKCAADVLRIFIMYWLERDIEKGKSRWSFSTEDRAVFCEYVAWSMFEENLTELTFHQFDTLVQKFVEVDLKPKELASLSLDLQTTGVFSLFGGALRIMANGFFDYFVASRFMKWELAAIPRRAPNAAQVELMLGIAESQNRDVQFDTLELLKESGVKVPPSQYQPIKFPSHGILYGSQAGSPWPNVNGDGSTLSGCPEIRLLVHAVSYTDPEGIAVLVGNRLGLHARASAWVVNTYQNWHGHSTGWRQVYICRNGRTVRLNSIMDLMMIAAGVGSTVYFTSDDCSRSELENLLRILRCTPTQHGSGLWVSNWMVCADDRVEYTADDLATRSDWEWN